MSVRCIVVNVQFQAKRPKNPLLPRQLESVGDHIRKCRIERRLSQPDVAELIGVDPLTITNWELGHTQPWVRYMPLIIRFLGYNPWANNDSTLGQKFKSWRMKEGLTIKQVGSLTGLDGKTVQRIEADVDGLSRLTVQRVEGLVCQEQ